MLGSNRTWNSVQHRSSSGRFWFDLGRIRTKSVEHRSSSDQSLANSSVPSDEAGERLGGQLFLAPSGRCRRRVDRRVAPEPPAARIRTIGGTRAKLVEEVALDGPEPGTLDIASASSRMAPMSESEP